MSLCFFTSAASAHSREQAINYAENNERYLELLAELQRRGALGESLMDYSVEKLERVFHEAILPHHPNGPKLTSNLVEFYFKRKGVDVSWNPLLTTFPRFVFDATNAALWMKLILKYCLMILGSVAFCFTFVFGFLAKIDRGSRWEMLQISGLAFTVVAVSWAIVAFM